jgi:hypothetical protein
MPVIEIAQQVNLSGLGRPANEVDGLFHVLRVIAIPGSEGISTGSVHQDTTLIVTGYYRTHPFGTLATGD